MVIKLGSVIYNKLLLQAEEAKDQNLDKLASGIFSALEDEREESDENTTYCYKNLNNDVYCGMWKLASNIIKYYDLESVDAQKIDGVIESLANKFISELELTLDVDNIVGGPFEEKVPGEIK